MVRFDENWIDEFVDKSYSRLYDSVKDLIELGYNERRSVEDIFQYITDMDLPLVIREPIERLIMRVNTSDMTKDEKEAFYAMVIDDDIQNHSLENSKRFYFIIKNIHESIKKKKSDEEEEKGTGN